MNTTPQILTNKKILNYTPHKVTIFDANNQPIVFEPVGLARGEPTFTVVKIINGIPILDLASGAVEGLPDADETGETFYIVSRSVAKAFGGKRKDIFFPIDTFRDENGTIIGCRSFTIFR